MDGSKEVLPPDDRLLVHPVDQENHQNVASPKFCEICGVEVRGSACDRLRGLYYCRTCYRHQTTIHRFKQIAIHFVITFLGFLALCALILFLIWIFDGYRFVGF